MATRRGRGEGSIIQRHDHKSCPALVPGPPDEDGEPTKIRPVHVCKGRWAKTVDLGWSAGRRQRVTIYAPTKGDLLERAVEFDGGAPSNWTVKSWITYWLAEVAPERCRPQTMTSHTQKANAYIIPLLGKHRLDQLEPRHIRDMYKRMRADCPKPDTDTGKCAHKPSHGLSEATLRQTHAILRRALEIAKRERYVSENAATLMDAPSTKTKRRDRLTVPQAKLALAGARGDYMESRWWCALHEGMRQGECLGLAWQMVNFDEGTITIARTLTITAGKKTYGDPKSESSRRTIPMTPQVRSQLLVHWAKYAAECMKAGVEPDPLASVWSLPDGSPIGPKVDWKRWTQLLDKAGVPRVALHSARNTTAALLEEANVPARLAAEILGHSTVDQTYGYQKDAGLENRKAAMLAFEAAWNKEPREITSA